MQRKCILTLRFLATGPFKTLERSAQRDYYNHHKLTSMMTIRNMGGGPRNDEHKERLRAIRKARKIYFKSLPERGPKSPVCTKHYDEVIKWKTEPISKKIEHRVIHICSFIIYAWLNAYPHGASLRKLQRDIAFRMQRKHRIPGKLPYQVIMPIVGKLERENYLSIRMKSNGHVLIYRDKDVNITPEGQTHMDMGKDEEIDDKDEEIDEDDKELFNVPLLPHEVADTDVEIEEYPTIPMPARKISNGKIRLRPSQMVADTSTDGDMEEDQTMLSRPIPEDQIPYEKSNFRPKFSKEQKPKVKKIKTKKAKNRSRSDPVMDPVELPPNTIPTSRGPRFIVETSDTVPAANTTTTAESVS
jgi:hypothetical protein